MSSYWNVLRPYSDCVHFIYADKFDGDGSCITTRMKEAGIRWVYVDYLHIKTSHQHIADAIGMGLGLQHAPYPPRTSPYQPKIWVPFLDDLVGLSLRNSENGIVIIIDNANLFLEDSIKDFFELIETFLTQFSDWFKRQKPCHLCFQMESSEAVRNLFAS